MPGINRLATFFTLVAIVLAGVLTNRADAHFIYVAKSKENGKYQVFFGEGLEPDNAKFLSGIADMKVFGHDSSGKVVALKFEKKVNDNLGHFECVGNNNYAVVDIDCEYGVFSRGSSGMFLHYCAKYVDGLEQAPKSSGKLKLDIVPKMTDKGCVFQVLFDGKPITDCELTASNLDNDTVEYQISANDKGHFLLDEFAAGRWSVRAKKATEETGEVDGNKFTEKRYYCTLILDHGSQVKKQATDKKTSETNADKSVSTPDEIAELPFGITSFGAAVLNDHVYVYGGHRGEAHNYYASGQNNRLYELNLEKPGQWKQIGEGPGLQGLAMVACNGNLYRLGGFAAHNKKSEDSDLHSVNEFAVFDFENKKWNQLAPMPTARSSFDAVAVGNVIYVVGGWALNGSEKTVWEESALKIDMSADNPKWEKLPNPPFKRRAVSVAYQGDKIYVVGGMQSNRKISTEVAVFDTKTNKWSNGPALPGNESMEGFGTSSFNVGGTLVVSTYGGNVYRLDEKASKWVKITTMDPSRFFHRLLPVNNTSFFLVGGANMEYGKTTDCPIISLDVNKN